MESHYCHRKKVTTKRISIRLIWDMKRSIEVVGIVTSASKLSQPQDAQRISGEKRALSKTHNSRPPANVKPILPLLSCAKDESNFLDWSAPAKKRRVSVLL